MDNAETPECSETFVISCFERKPIIYAVTPATIVFGVCSNSSSDFVEISCNFINIRSRCSSFNSNAEHNLSAIPYCVYKTELSVLENRETALHNERILTRNNSEISP